MGLLVTVLVPRILRLAPRVLENLCTLESLLIGIAKLNGIERGRAKFV
jgi:hypothetical protein